MFFFQACARFLLYALLFVGFLVTGFRSPHVPRLALLIFCCSFLDSFSYGTNFSMIDSFVKNMSQVFLYVGLVLAVFAALLLSNFISVSISNKKRDIGILRAVGARSLDVFKIFFSESFVIGLICTAVSCGASYCLCSMINQEYSADLGASVFVFGIPSIAVLVGIAALTIVVATFLPVYNAAKKKPVDSIKG